jgi:hypothetical protein
MVKAQTFISNVEPGKRASIGAYHNLLALFIFWIWSLLTPTAARIVILKM